MSQLLTLAPMCFSFHCNPLLTFIVYERQSSGEGDWCDELTALFLCASADKTAWWGTIHSIVFSQYVIRNHSPQTVQHVTNPNTQYKHYKSWPYKSPKQLNCFVASCCVVLRSVLSVFMIHKRERERKRERVCVTLNNNHYKRSNFSASISKKQQQLFIMFIACEFGTRQTNYDITQTIWVKRVIL